MDKNKKKKHRFIRIKWAVILFGILSLIGCEDTHPEDLEKEKVVITVWTKDRHDAQFQMQKVREFNEQNNENIYVEYEIYGDNYAQVVNNALLNHNGSDLMVYTSQIFYNHIGDGTFVDLIPFMDAEFQETFGNMMLEGFNVFDGQCYFVPTAASACRLFYNKTIFEKAGFEEPPATLEEMIYYAEQITKELSSEGVYGFAVNLKNAQAALNRSFFKEVNIDFGLKSGYDFARGCYDFTQMEGLIEAWRELLSAKCAYPDCRNLDIDPLRQLFAAGKIGMYISYTHSEMGVFLEQFPMEDDWGCAQIPLFGEKRVGAQNYSLNNGYLINAESEYLEEAWKVYMAIFADIENLKEYHIGGYGTSVIPKVLEAVKEDGYQINDMVCSIGEFDAVWPLAPHEREPEAVEPNGLNMYDTLKELILGEEEIAPVLRKLTNCYNEAYQAGIESGKGEVIQIPNFDPLNPRVREE